MTFEDSLKRIERALRGIDSESEFGNHQNALEQIVVVVKHLRHEVLRIQYDIIGLRIDRAQKGMDLLGEVATLMVQRDEVLTKLMAISAEEPR